jgi:hypothetical protein
MTGLMRELLRMQRIPLAAGALACLAVLAAELLSSKDRREGLREVAFDLVLAADEPSSAIPGLLRSSEIRFHDIRRGVLAGVWKPSARNERRCRARRGHRRGQTNGRGNRHSVRRRCPLLRHVCPRASLAGRGL